MTPGSRTPSAPCWPGWPWPSAGPTGGSGGGRRSRCSAQCSMCHLAVSRSGRPTTARRRPSSTAARRRLSLSLSHRDGVAVAAVARLPTRVGIDLETLEARSDAFVREWLSSEEQAALPSAGEARDLQVLCCWTGKEASAKVLREGLRLDVRRAVVVADTASRGDWAPLRGDLAHRGRRPSRLVASRRRYGARRRHRSAHRPARRRRLRAQGCAP